MTTDPRPNVVAISPLQLDADLIGTAAQALRDGLLVAFPTETVYGLGCNALDETAIAKVFAAKGRPSSDPLIVHVDGLPMVESVIEGPLPPAAKALADAFWPGPLTMILPRGQAVPLAVTSGLESVAVRCPSHPVAAALIHEARIPITAPSA
ncbi:L-threonylcarbamoyladenylate synthase, partial [bacterium]|nr:L-threonylcarbamoyladenylate synthase [bacterium]